jgi:hypothetical protein
MVEILEATDTQVVRVRLKRLGTSVEGGQAAGGPQPAREPAQDGEAGSRSPAGGAASQ